MAYFKAKENEARALLLNCPISQKFSAELGMYIKGKPYSKVVAYLDDVIEMKRYVPLPRFNDDVGHRAGMEGKVKSGRYPVKAAKFFKKALTLAKSNAEHKGLDSEDLAVVGIVANPGVRRPTIQPGGRRRLRYTKSVHLEVLVRQRHKLKPKKEEKKEDKKVEPKTETKVEAKKESAPIKTEEKQDKVADKATSKTGKDLTPTSKTRFALAPISSKIHTKIPARKG